MIPQSEAICQTQKGQPASWQDQLINCVTTADELCRLLQIKPSQVRLSERAAKLFPLRVPRYFVSLMETANPRDPLLQQVLNQSHEDTEVKGSVLIH